LPRLSEDALIATYFASFAGAGALNLGDDAALLKPQPGEELVLTKDMLVAGVHFFSDDPPDAIARKALRVNLSDLAAKGAMPRGFLLGLGLPADWQDAWLKAFAEGLRDDAAHFGIDLLGGDTVHVPGPLTLSVTAIGSVPEGRMVPRAGAQDGDLIFVSGTIGDAALGLRLRLAEAAADAVWIAKLSEDERAHLAARYLLPQPRLALREALRKHARSAMDISDGLAGDLAKMLRLAKLTAEVEIEKILLSAAARTALSTADVLQTILCGGDDYEILCTIPPDRAGLFQEEAEKAGVTVKQIGICHAGESLPRFKIVNDRSFTFEAGSFQHF